MIEKEKVLNSSLNSKSDNYFKKKYFCNLTYLHVHMKKAVLYRGKRYQLWRIWDPSLPLVLFVLLNPSVGDAAQDDPTLRRLLYFAKKFGFGGFYVGNLYAEITPYPNPLSKTPEKRKEKPWAPKDMLSHCERVVFAWGRTEPLPLWLDEMVQEPCALALLQMVDPNTPYIYLITLH